MQRSTAYTVAKYTSWIAILLNILVVVWGFAKDFEAAAFYSILVLPFLLVPWVVFLIGIWASGKWEKSSKYILSVILIACILFVISILYMLSENANALLVVLASPIIIGVEISLILSTK